MKILKWIFSCMLHRFWVMLFILKFAAKLIWRGIIHDLSKYSLYEMKGYSKTFHKLKGTTFGSPEYQKLLDELKPIIAHHYNKNSHHPQYHYGTVYETKGMLFFNLVDLVEMFLDWRAAVKKHKDGNILKSISFNSDKFAIPLMLRSIFINSTK